MISMAIVGAWCGELLGQVKPQQFARCVGSSGYF
jgi:hypothetical protein